MSGEIKIAFIGGDLRMLVAARELAARGFEIALFGLDIYEGDYGEITRSRELAGAVGGATAVVLPLPWSGDGFFLNCPLTRAAISVKSLFASLAPGQLLLGGQLSDKAFELARVASVTAVDYYAPEEVSVLNAVPSAEGAVAIAINELPITLHSANAAVVGYGRIGKMLAKILASLGAEVTVFARSREARAWARANGMKSLQIEDLKDELIKTDVIFNTVPHILFDAPLLRNIRSDAVMLDLASSPGGADPDAVRESGVRYIRALSLPGRTAPVTAGKIIAEAIITIIKENIKL